MAFSAQYLAHEVVHLWSLHNSAGSQSWCDVQLPIFTSVAANIIYTKRLLLVISSIITKILYVRSLIVAGK